MSKQSFILDIEWSVPNMPRLVGPFETRKEADEFARLNVPNGSWTVCPLTFPYSAGGSSDRESVIECCACMGAEYAPHSCGRESGGSDS